ncbi:MAG TPA: 30S ribosome-binding factor RbfA [Cyanobacteria bacterium UBA11369]|nr:30S ribosome-binding factor RbfA [Cyanobacteria bacterium UBA11371]HBE51003.1 30S ribosome-binding factor RbfA [Cyanobacteria bacterium UBA11369]
MATNRRVSRVAAQIQREVSQLLQNGIKDDRVGSSMVSVTDVDVSNDLQHAKIFVSLYGTNEAKAETMAALKEATGFVRKELGARVRLRRTPEVVFVEDHSLERGDRILSLINQLSSNRRDDDELEEDDSDYDTVSAEEEDKA